ncbi:hypothetical protein Scep_014798 [Stephania cephalantha]|uniref:Uncharacterized protein n=1 Tax=Stephania cephalantha TaxID=152367 RepID=A0AAP0J1Q1_9MAGN
MRGLGDGSSVEEDHARTEETQRINAAEEVEAAEEEGRIWVERGGEWRRRRGRGRSEEARRKKFFVCGASGAEWSFGQEERGQWRRGTIVSAEEK